MRKLEYNEFKQCQIIANFFEDSLTKCKLNSPRFIQRFMMSEEAKQLFDTSYLISSTNMDNIFDSFNNLSVQKNKIFYSNDQMYWIGYIYGALGFLYHISPKALYKLFPAKEIVSYYNIYHTFDIEEAAERMLENIDFNTDLTARGLIIFKKLLKEDL